MRTITLTDLQYAILREQFDLGCTDLLLENFQATNPHIELTRKELVEELQEISSALIHAKRT